MLVYWTPPSTSKQSNTLRQKTWPNLTNSNRAIGPLWCLVSGSVVTSVTSTCSNSHELQQAADQKPSSLGRIGTPFADLDGTLLHSRGERVRRKPWNSGKQLLCLRCFRAKAVGRGRGVEENTGEGRPNWMDLGTDRRPSGPAWREPPGGAHVPRLRMNS